MDVPSILIPFVERFDVESRSQRAREVGDEQSPQFPSVAFKSMFVCRSGIPTRMVLIKEFVTGAACRCIRFKTNAVLRRLQWVLRPLSTRLLGINLVTADVAERARVLPPCEFRNEPRANPAAMFYTSQVIRIQAPIIDTLGLA
jgi:hypothetical protein